jgi:hypothetical protein
VATGIEAIFKVPQFELLVDLGATEAASEFGSHGMVNINVNHASNKTLVCDKITMDASGSASLISAQRLDADGEPEDDPNDPDPTPADNSQDSSTRGGNGAGGGGWAV